MHVFILLVLITGSYGYENIALGKPTNQSTTYMFSWNSGKAVDGDKIDISSVGTCAISKDNKTTAWWYVDLGKHLPIDRVSIFYRGENASLLWESVFKGRFSGFFLYISNDTSKENGHLCYHEILDSPTQNQIVECPSIGRYVIYYNERDPNKTYPVYYNKYAYIELCEVEVYGCPDVSQYGEDCLNCSTGCKDGRCDIKTGTCSCLQGFTGFYCNKSCGYGTYGDQCMGHCGACRDGEPCNHVTGSCVNGCAEGRYGDKCVDECRSGYYGYDCNSTCSDTCVTPGLCNRYTGKCLGGCLSGYKGDKCDSECESGMYGVSCNMSCGFCFHGDTCHHVNGSCLRGCSEGYQGELCDDVCSFGKYGLLCEHECSVLCQKPRDCHHMTGNCLNGCREGFIGPHCMDVEGPVFSSGTTYVLIAILSTLVLVNVVCIIVFIIRRFSRSKDPKADASGPKKTPRIVYENENFTEKESGSSYQELKLN
ncbi:multiple epidermal growth factor-like domains protein 10 [Saccostrea cucullata]|uniref:multiple epidermal growth factor-like domains protein 10 n=1 Tax=Saccostrea cuccullata TaxID=36930 RepID=UPI002ED2FB34